MGQKAMSPGYRFRKMPPRFRAWLRDVFEPWRRARGSKRAGIVAEQARRPVHRAFAVHSPLCYSDLPPDFPQRAFVSFWEAVTKQRIRNARAAAKS